MKKVLVGMAVSLDGYAADASGSLDKLYPSLEALRETDYLKEVIATTGAVVMGRHAYAMAEGQPDGLEGYEFQTPIFVLCHQRPARVVPGENENLRLYFVHDGIESAIRQAKAAAGERNVHVIGGASTMRQVLKAHLYDEMEILVAPVLLGSGLRLFDGVDPAELTLIEVRKLASLGHVVLRYRPKGA
ncbi:MAG: dihydrofolate reductase family protein [Anaerolineae bacterium]